MSPSWEYSRHHDGVLDKGFPQESGKLIGRSEQGSSRGRRFLSCEMSGLFQDSWKERDKNPTGGTYDPEMTHYWVE